MSEAHFHVHGPHDHELEHQGQHGDRFAGRIAVLTAVLSTVGALLGYEAGHSGNLALMYKNDAAINKTHASDQWNFYQAKSSKQNLAELGLALAPPAKQEFYQSEIARYKKEKDEIMAEAKKYDKLSVEANEKAEAESHVHERWALGLTFMQVSIALAAITLLTRKSWLLYGVYLATGVGVVAAGMALAHL
jgi:hypothetical protein